MRTRPEIYFLEVSRAIAKHPLSADEGLALRQEYKYKLVGSEPEPVASVVEWGQWFEAADRKVALTQVKNRVYISTVFLGIDHAFGGRLPLLFETMVFGGRCNGFCFRCSTSEQAAEVHIVVVEALFRIERVPRWYRSRTRSTFSAVRGWAHRRDMELFPRELSLDAAELQDV